MTAATDFPTRLAFPLLLLPLAACGSDDDDSSFVVRATTHAAVPSAAIVVQGDWMVYFASEAMNGLTGTILNNDGDMLDAVAFAVNTRSAEEENVRVAAMRAAIVGAEIYLVVDESADGVDWDMDTFLDDVVLVHWSQTAATPTFVDVLDPGAALVTVPLSNGDRLFYTSAGAPLGVADETFLRTLAASAPTTPKAVLAPSGGLFRGGSPPVVRPLRQDSGLLFCVVDETADGVNYNGDGDFSDEAVLVLLDATGPFTDPPDPLEPLLESTGLAMADGNQPLDALTLAAHRWLVAFLVDEMEQGPTNLNLDDGVLFPLDSLVPLHCAGMRDGDTLDRVLHYFDFDADPLMGAPVNTGLAGHSRVLALGALNGTTLDGFVATISAEDEANCNLNRGTTVTDTDTNDDVLRWIATTPGATPENDENLLHDLATGIDGGSFGVAILDNRFVAVIDEAADTRNHDTKVDNHELVAWLDPDLASPSWHFSHQAQTADCCSTNPPNACRFGTGVFDSDCDPEPFAGTSWMASEAVDGRLALVFLEEVPGTNPNVGSLNTNLDCALVAKDTDKLDGLPVWADFESGPTLDFDGVGYSVDRFNAGIEIAMEHAFFRVSESEDGMDYDDDPADNVVLFRNPLGACAPVFMGTAGSMISQVIITDRRASAAFLSTGVDFDEDGNEFNDPVVRYFRY